jgi:hypothetical protein
VIVEVRDHLGEHLNGRNEWFGLKNDQVRSCLRYPSWRQFSAEIRLAVTETRANVQFVDGKALGT